VCGAGHFSRGERGINGIGEISLMELSVLLIDVSTYKNLGGRRR
jgi:hypothetical protein